LKRPKLENAAVGNIFRVDGAKKKVTDPAVRISLHRGSMTFSLIVSQLEFSPLERASFIDGREFILGYAANRANPALRNIFKRRARVDALIRVTGFRVVNIIARIACILLHFEPPVRIIPENQSRDGAPESHISPCQTAR
jgi:hypothetical protein